VGAALDFIAGSRRRAPRWMQSVRMEWFWRLMNEPRRLAARYAICALVFLSLIVETAVRATMGRGMGAPATQARSNVATPLAPGYR